MAAAARAKFRASTRLAQCGITSLTSAVYTAVGGLKLNYCPFESRPTFWAHLPDPTASLPSHALLHKFLFDSAHFRVRYDPRASELARAVPLLPSRFYRDRRQDVAPEMEGN